MNKLDKCQQRTYLHFLFFEIPEDKLNQLEEFLQSLIPFHESSQFQIILNTPQSKKEPFLFID